MGRVLLFWLTAGALGLWVFLHFYPQAFPEASIDFRINRHQALAAGERALRELGVQNLGGYIPSVDFDWLETPKRFLEKTMGLAKANEIMRREVAVWGWSCEWKRPRERRSYSATVTPDGQVVSASILLPEEEVGPSLTEQQARKIADEFARKKLGLNLSEWKLVTATQYKRPNRLDYTFTYEHRHKKFPPSAKNPATVRFDVTVAGDKVVDYSLRYLHIPEWWRFEEGRKRTARILLLIVTRTAFGLLILALSVFLFVVSLRRKEIPPWRVLCLFPPWLSPLP